MTRTKLERAVLGGMLRHPPAIPDALLTLAADDFGAFRPVAESVFDLWGKGKPVDLVGVGEELRRRGQVDAVGGLSVLADLWDSQPTGAHVAYHAELLRDAMTLLRLEEVAGTILRDAREPPATAAEVLDSALSAVCSVADRLHRGRDHGIDELVDQASARLDARAIDPRSDCVPTGLADLDAMLQGLRPSELTVMAARPSVGKTGLAVHVAVEAARAGVRTLFCSLEQSRAELADRILAREARVEGDRLREPRLLVGDEWSRLSEARDALRTLPLRVDDAPDQSALRIAATSRRLRFRPGLGLLVVDYLQLVRPEGDHRTPRQEQVAGISRRFKALARELEAPVLVLAQLNRASEERADGRPRLSDLRESGQIEADADVVWLLSRVPGQPDCVDLQVAKNRNGRTGDVVLTFDRARMRWGDYAGVPFARPDRRGDLPP